MVSDMQREFSYPRVTEIQSGSCHARKAYAGLFSQRALVTESLIRVPQRAGVDARHRKRSGA
jgi:hypothetical protein